MIRRQRTVPFRFQHFYPLDADNIMLRIIEQSISPDRMVELLYNSAPRTHLEDFIKWSLKNPTISQCDFLRIMIVPVENSANEEQENRV